MPEIPPDELRRMARAIDADHEPRVDVRLDLSAFAVQRLRDALTSIAADLEGEAGIEVTWPFHAALDQLEPAADEAGANGG